MTAITQLAGLLSGEEAAADLHVAAATVRSWRARGYITPVAKTRQGSRTTCWYRSTDIWRCARERLSRRQLAEINDLWAEVDRLLAEHPGQVPL